MMVSTRGVKVKFFEGEKVLCYEPDPTKAKVLYDSKVLKVVIEKDQRGRKNLEYLIHFQGWNSSWDRCVGEEFVLKDTPENRQLQKDLAAKSQLQFGAYLYRKDRKKPNSRGKTESSSPEDDNSGSPSRMDTEAPLLTAESSSEEEEGSSSEEDTISIELSTELREFLDNDFYQIKEKRKLHKLPAEPNVVTILECYYRHFATNQICGLNDKSSNKHRTNPNNQPKRKPEDIQKNLTLCREVLDGIRVYFDFTLNDNLLYKPEAGQIQTKPAIAAPLCDVKLEKEDDSSDNYTNHHAAAIDDFFQQNGNEKPLNNRRRTLRSNRSDSHTNGNSLVETNNNPKPGSSIASSNSDTNGGPMAKTMTWRMLPDTVLHQQPPPPCIVYGATHLVRLFVRLPDYLMASSITETKMKIILSHIDQFLDFLSEHKEWFGDKMYLDTTY